MDLDHVLSRVRDALDGCDLDGLLDGIDCLEVGIRADGVLPDDWEPSLGEAASCTEASRLRTEMLAAWQEAMQADRSMVPIPQPVIRRLRTAFAQLDEHLSAGGAMPSAWQRAVSDRECG